MPRALNKVQKHISKKKGGKPTALHENSRDARRLRTAGAREDKIARIATAAARSNRIYVNRVAWMKDHLGELNTPLTDEEVIQVVKDYIAREDDELNELKAAQRPGRPKSKAEERIQVRIDAEEHEFASGFWAPDFRDEEALQKLQRWTEDWAGLGYLKVVRVYKNGEIKASSFPPKSLS